MNRLRAGAIFALCLAAKGAYCGPIAPGSLANLAQTADLIVAGSASGGSQSGSALSFSIQVERVVKGDPTLAGNVIPVDWTAEDNVGNAMARSEFTAAGNGLWFLQRSPSAWSVLPLMNGFARFDDTFFPMPRGPILAAYAYSSTATLSDKVASEVSSALEFAGTDPKLPFFLYSASLDEFKSPVVHLLYTRLAASNSVNQKSIGLSGLIREGSVSALIQAQQIASAPGASSLVSGAFYDAIRNQFRSTDPAAIQALGEMATKSNGVSASLREASAFALRAIHTKDALPYLAALLDDPDQSLRAEGIGGLACFANGLPIQLPEDLRSMKYLQRPASAPYKTEATEAHFVLALPATVPNEILYLSFWKEWWVQHRGELGY